MNRKKSLVGIGLIAALMALTGWLLFRDQPVTRLLHTLGQLRPGWLLLGLALMLAFVGCEATCSHLILGRLGHRAPLRRCLGYSFVGFYVSSITPSSTGGQPAQIYYMSKDGVPAAHGSLNMMLIAVCYQVVTLLYAAAAFFGLSRTHQGLGTGVGLLLLYGGAVLAVLTAGMLCMMFLPNAAARLTGGVLGLLVRLRLVRREAELREKLERQMAEYRRGAECLKRNLPLLPALAAGVRLLRLLGRAAGRIRTARSLADLRTIRLGGDIGGNVGAVGIGRVGHGAALRAGRRGGAARTGRARPSPLRSARRRRR